MKRFCSSTTIATHKISSTVDSWTTVKNRQQRKKYPTSIRRSEGRTILLMLNLLPPEISCSAPFPMSSKPCGISSSISTPIMTPKYWAMTTSVWTPAGRPKGFPSDMLSCSFLNARAKHIKDIEAAIMPDQKGIEHTLAVVSRV